MLLTAALCTGQVKHVFTVSDFGLSFAAVDVYKDKPHVCQDPLDGKPYMHMQYKIMTRASS